MLAKHPRVRAHFHWFKGSESTVNRLIDSGFVISVTPDVCYEAEIQRMVGKFPIERIMVEKDGPWPFEGPFLGELTKPRLMRDAIAAIARMKRMSVEAVTHRLYDNTVEFYRLPGRKKGFPPSES